MNASSRSSEIQRLGLTPCTLHDQYRRHQNAHFQKCVCMTCAQAQAALSSFHDAMHALQHAGEHAILSSHLRQLFNAGEFALVRMLMQQPCQQAYKRATYKRGTG